MCDKESTNDKESTREIRRGTKYESSEDESAGTSHGGAQQGTKRTLSQLLSEDETEDSEPERSPHQERERRKRHWEQEYRETKYAKEYLARLALGESSSSDEEAQLMDAVSSSHSDTNKKGRPDSPTGGKYLTPLFWETFFNQQVENAPNRSGEVEDPDQNAAKTIYTQQLGPDENQPSTSGVTPLVVGDCSVSKGLSSRPGTPQIPSFVVVKERRQQNLDTVDEEDDLDVLEWNFRQLNASAENNDANTTVANVNRPSVRTNIPDPNASDDTLSEGDTCPMPKWENEYHTESDEGYVPDSRTYVVGKLDNIDDANTTDGETVSVPEEEVVNAAEKKFTHIFMDDDLAELLAGEPESSDEELLSEEEESDEAEVFEDEQEDPTEDDEGAGDGCNDDEGAGDGCDEAEMDVDSNVDNTPDAMDQEEQEDEMMEDGETTGPDQVTDDVISMVVDAQREDASPPPVIEPVSDVAERGEFKFGQRPGLRQILHTIDRNPILGDDTRGMMQLHVLKKVPQRSAGNPITGEGYDELPTQNSRYTHTKKAVHRSDAKPADDDKLDSTEAVGDLKHHVVKSITEIGNGIEYNVFPPEYKMRITRRNREPVSDADNVTLPATPLTKFTPDTGMSVVAHTYVPDNKKGVRLLGFSMRKGIRRNPLPENPPKVRMGYEQLRIVSMIAKIKADQELMRHLDDLHFFDKCWDSLWSTKKDTSKKGRLVSELSNLTPSKTDVAIASDIYSKPTLGRPTRRYEECLSDVDCSEYGQTETERHPEVDEVNWPENCYSDDDARSDSDNSCLERPETQYSEEGQARKRQVPEARQERPGRKRGTSASKVEKRSKTGGKRPVSQIRGCISNSSDRFGSKAQKMGGSKAPNKTKSKDHKKVGSKAPKCEKAKTSKKTGLKASKKTGLNAPKTFAPQSERVSSASDQDSLEPYDEKDMQVCIYNNPNRQPTAKPSFMSFIEDYNIPKTVEELAALHINDKISVTGESESTTSTKDYYHGYYTTSDDGKTVKSLLELEWPYEVNDPDVGTTIEEEISEEKITKEKIGKEKIGKGKIGKGKMSEAEVSTTDGEDYGEYDTMGFGPLLNDIFSCLQETRGQMAKEKKGRAKQQKCENLTQKPSKLKKKGTTKKQKDQTTAKRVKQGPYGTELPKSKKIKLQKKSKAKAQEKDLSTTLRQDHVNKSQDGNRQPKPAQTPKLPAQTCDYSAPSTSRQHADRPPKPAQSSKLTAQSGDYSAPSTSRQYADRQPKPAKTPKLPAQSGDYSAPSTSRQHADRQPKPAKTPKLPAQSGDYNAASTSRQHADRPPKPAKTPKLPAQSGDYSAPSTSRQHADRQPKPAQTPKLPAQSGDYSAPSTSRQHADRQPKPAQTPKLPAQSGDYSAPSTSRQHADRPPKPAQSSKLTAQSGDYSAPSTSRRNDVQKKARKVVPNTSARVTSPLPGHRISNEADNEISFSKWTKKSQQVRSTWSKENLALPKKLPGRTGESGVRDRVVAGAPNRSTVKRDSPSKMLAAQDRRENVLRSRPGPSAPKYVSPYSVPLHAGGLPKSGMNKRAPTVVQAARRVPKIDPYSAAAIDRMRRKPDWQ